MARVRIDEHVEDRYPLKERPIVVDVELGLGVARNGFAIVDTLCIASVDRVFGVGLPGSLRLGFLDELVSRLDPPVTTDDPVIDSEADLVLVLVLPPQVVQHLLDDDGLGRTLGLARVDDEAWIVDCD